MSFSGFLQVDKEGNGNPSMLPGSVFPPGGFPGDCRWDTPKTDSAGTFTAGQTKIDIVNNKLRIQK